MEFQKGSRETKQIDPTDFGQLGFTLLSYM